MTQASWVESVSSNDTLLIVKLMHQYTDQSVVSMEQFSLGGMNTIRGYRENQLIRDNAVVISPELRIPVYKDRYGKALVYMIPFFDYGTGWNTNGPRNRETIYSAGLASRTTQATTSTWPYTGGMRLRISTFPTTTTCRIMASTFKSESAQIFGIQPTT